MKKFLLNTSIVLLLFSFGCQPKDKYYNIDPNTKLKFKQNDTLIFNSALRADTFLISGISDGYTINDGNTYWEYYDVGYLKLNYNWNEDSIYKDDSWYSYGESPPSGNGAEWRNLYTDSTSGYNNKDTTLQIGKLQITNVHYLYALLNKKHYFPNDVIKVYYCYEYGVVEYVRYDGEVFILNSKCISKYIK